MTKREMKTAVRKEKSSRSRERQKQSKWTLVRDCWPPISNLSSCGCKLLLVVL